MIVIDYSGGGEEREARSPVQVVDLTSREEVQHNTNSQLRLFESQRPSAIATHR